MAGLPGVLVGKEGGHHRLAVHPPKLHPPLQLGGAVPTHIQEVEQTTVLKVKAICIRFLNELLNGYCLQFGVTPVIMRS